MEKQASFRFYEELNDFLPLDKKKMAFEYSFGGAPSIKDAIEAIGIPHVEAGLILVNGSTVDFDYNLQNEDVVSVYPSNKPLRGTKFILDVHLGKLAKYLRMLGFDTIYQNDYDDNEIIQISLAERRVILTRDIGLLKVKSVILGYFIRDQKPKRQLAEVLNHFDLYKFIDSFSRCIKCNGKLETVGKEEIIKHLEPLTIKHFSKFYRCTACQSIFWEGSHFDRMSRFINTIKNSCRNQELT